MNMYKIFYFITILSMLLGLGQAQVPVVIGTGTDYYRIPIDLYYKNSISQTVYYPNELNTNGGIINKLVYRASITQTGMNSQPVGIQIWIGETSLDNLASGWVNFSSFTEVYD
jgi:hypothetical protein